MSKDQLTPETNADAPTGEAQSNADLAQIANGLTGDMPDVQEHAVQQAHAQQVAQSNSPTDKSGAMFDPAIHVTGADGKGVMTVRGTWAQKRGRKANEPQAPQTARNAPQAKSILGGPAAPPSPQMLADQQKMQQDMQSRAAGVAAAEMLFMVGQIVGGDEWKPMQNKEMGLDERALMHGAFGDYFVSKGKTDIPPGAALGFAVIAYMAPRFAMPKTQTRFQKLKGAVVTWWTNRKLRKMGLDVQVQQKTSEVQK